MATLTVTGTVNPGSTPNVEGAGLRGKARTRLRWLNGNAGGEFRSWSNGSFRVASPAAPSVGARDLICEQFAAGRWKEAARTTVTVTEPAPAPEPTPPPPTVTISNLRVTENTDTTLRVQWSVSELATGKVEYRVRGTTTWSVREPQQLTPTYKDHDQTITGLEPGKCFDIRVTSNGVSATLTGDPMACTDPAPPSSPPPTPPPSGTANVAAGLNATDLRAAIVANAAAGRMSVLAAGATYSLGSTMTFSGINGVTVDLNGATLDWTVNTVGINLTNCFNHRWTNGTLRGQDSSGVYMAGDQHNHGFSLNGGGNHYFDLHVEHFRGDGYYLNHSGNGPGNGVQIRGSIGTVSRMQIAPVSWDNGQVISVVGTGTCYRPVDFEPDANSSIRQTVRNWTVDGYAFTGTIRGEGSGTSWLYIGTPYGADPNRPLVPIVSGITVKNCRITNNANNNHNFMETDFRFYRGSNIRIESNTSTTNWGRTANLQNVDTLVVTNNDGNSNTSPAVVTTGSTNVTNAGNT